MFKFIKDYKRKMKEYKELEQINKLYESECKTFNKNWKKNQERLDQFIEKAENKRIYNTEIEDNYVARYDDYFVKFIKNEEEQIELYNILHESGRPIAYYDNEVKFKSILDEDQEVINWVQEL